MFSGKIILNFGVQKRLRAFLNPIFTGGVVEENGSYKKSPHDTDLKSKDNRGSLWGGFGRYLHTALEVCAEHRKGCPGSIF